MVYPLLISITNINPEIHSKISLHTYLLLTLLPIIKFTYKQTHSESSAGQAYPHSLK